MKSKSDLHESINLDINTIKKMFKKANQDSLKAFIDKDYKTAEILASKTVILRKQLDMYSQLLECETVENIQNYSMNTYDELEEKKRDLHDLIMNDKNNNEYLQKGIFDVFFVHQLQEMILKLFC